VAVASGTLSDQELDAVYSTASCVVYPSTYEGFGLPIVESLARGLTVYVRDSLLNRWIEEHWNGPGKLVYYDTAEDLVQRLRKAELADGHAGSVASGPPSDGFPPNGRSWDDIASRTWDFLREFTEDDSLGQFWRRLDHQHRLDSFLAVNATSCGQHRPTSSKFIRDLPKKTVMEIRRFIRRRWKHRVTR
jgi:glycosyltransferase involved in cell wall biosynthesis